LEDGPRAWFGHIFASNMIGIGMWAGDGSIAEANDALLRLLGYTHDELGRLYPVDPEAAHGVARVIRTGESQLDALVTDQMLAVGVRDAEHLRRMRQLAPCSRLSVPLAARERIIGALTFAVVGPGRACGQNGAGPGDHLLVQVADEGIGVPVTALEAIFQPFSRAPNARESPMTGMGLGLYVCRSIIERHGGRLWAESPGEG
jgi:hypothetical protein